MTRLIAALKFVALTALIIAVLEFAAFVTFQIRPSGNPLAFPSGEARLHLYVAQSTGHYYTIKPHFTQRFRSDEFDTTISTNNRGFREDFDFDGRRPDIASVGDSFTFGHGVEAGERYTDRLREFFPHINVTTFAPANGGAPPSYYLYLKQNPEMIPRLLIVGLFPWNDLRGDMGAIQAQHDATGEMTGMTWNGRKVSSEGYLVSTELGSTWREPEWRKLARKFNLGRLALLAYHRIARAVDQGASSPPAASAEMAGKQLLTLEGGHFDENAHEALDYVGRIADLVESRSGRTLVLYIPASYMVGDYPYFCEIQAGVEKRRCLMLRTSSEERASLAQWFAEHPSISFLDPTDRFRELEKKGHKLYFDKDGHWKPAAHGSAAKLLRQRIINDRLLD